MKSELIRSVGRIVVGGYYDYQEIRKANANRVRDLIRKRNEGIAFDVKETEKTDEEKSWGKEYNDNELPGLLEKMKAEGKFTDEEYSYITRALTAQVESASLENAYKGLMDPYVKNEGLFDWLEKIRGVGPVLGANLLKNFDYCERYEHISSLWRHAGLHVVDGHAPKKVKGVKLDYNPKLRTLAWKIADSFVKQRTVPYRGIYDAEKARQLSLMETKAVNAPKSKKHAEMRARRKMIKIFLAHYWLVSRDMTGQPLSKPYAQDKLGHDSFIPPPGYEFREQKPE